MVNTVCIGLRTRRRESSNKNAAAQRAPRLTGKQRLLEEIIE